MNPSDHWEAAKAAKAMAAFEEQSRLAVEQRGEAIVDACQLAAELEHSRIASGLPPSQPAPWPKSTWEFLRRSAARVRGN